MPDTQSFIQALTQGPLAELAEMLNDEPRRMNTFLAEPAPHGPEQWMPLHHAALAGYLPAVDLLLERGVHPDCRTRFTTPMHARQTPLHLAATAGHVAVLKRLLEAGAEVEVRDAQQRSPLWLAARHHHAEAVTLLVRRGAALEARDTQQRTPLHAALLPPVADPPSNRSEKRADRRIIPHDPHDSAAKSFDGASVLALLAAGADPNATCPKEPAGFTPLHRCVSLGDPAFDIVMRLIEAGADPNAADPRHARTPYDLAVHLECSPAWTTLLS